MTKQIDLRALQVHPPSKEQAESILRDWEGGRPVHYFMRKYNLRVAFQVPALIELAHRTLGTPLRKCSNAACGIYEYRLPGGPQECPECGSATEAIGGVHQ